MSDVIKELQEREMKTFEIRMAHYMDVGAHLLIPTPNISEIPPMHSVVYEELYISSNPEDKEVYKGSSKKDGNNWINYLRLSGLGLNKIAICANVVWHTEATRVVTMERDYVSCQAVGGIRKTDGTVAYETKMADIDILIIKEKLEEQYYDDTALNKWLNFNKNKTVDDYKIHANACIKRDLQQKKQFKLQLAESAAKNRVIRHILPLKSEYTAEELSKPFVAIRFVFCPDYTDPFVKNAMLLKHLGASADIYGAQVSLPAPAPSPARPNEQHPEENEQEPIDTEYHEVDDGPTIDEQVAILCEEFDAMERGEQISAIQNLIMEINYDKSTLKTPVQRWKDNHLKSFYGANIIKKLS